MKIFFTKRNKIMVLVILLVVVFFFGLKSYFKMDEQDVEAGEHAKPLILNWLSFDQTYSNEEVKKILSDKFVTIKINARSENKVVEDGKEITERELAILYQVSGYPSTWFLERNHSRIAPLPGYVTTEQFIPVLNYIGEGWYKSISFKEYLEKI
jgi:thioredoxin-related protein